MFRTAAKSSVQGASITFAPCARATAIVSSDEPVSTTTISSTTGRALSMHGPSSSASSRAMTQRLTRMLRRAVAGVIGMTP
jgi:hypothetical protein